MRAEGACRGVGWAREMSGEWFVIGPRDQQHGKTWQNRGRLLKPPQGRLGAGLVEEWRSPMVYTMQDRLHENTSGLAVGLRKAYSHTCLGAHCSRLDAIGKPECAAIFPCRSCGAGFCASPPHPPPTNSVSYYPLHCAACLYCILIWGRRRPSSLVALCVAVACVGLSRAPSVGAVNPGIAGVLSASGVNYVLNSLIPVIERE